MRCVQATDRRSDRTAQSADQGSWSDAGYDKPLAAISSDADHIAGADGGSVAEAFCDITHDARDPPECDDKRRHRPDKFNVTGARCFTAEDAEIAEN